MEATGPTRGFFDAWSWVYDAPWVQRSTYWPVHDAVVRVLGPRPGRILDLGCGTGQLAARLARGTASGRVVGCDFSAGMLAQAATRRAAPPLVQGDAGRLPFADAAFDAIVCTEAFHWFPDPVRAVAECHRVLRPGGRLLVALVNMRIAAVGQLLELGSRLVGEPFYWPTRAEMRRWMTDAGFRVIGQQRVARLGSDLFSPTLTEAVRPARSHQGRHRSPPNFRRARC